MPVAGPGEAQAASEALRRARRCSEGEGALGAAQRGLAEAMTTRAAARLVAVACLLIALGTARVHSQPEVGSANAIMPGCVVVLTPAPRRRGPVPTPVEAGECLGEVDGIVETARKFGEVCPPPDVTTGQAVHVVVQYINARPERMHEQFSRLALEALTAAWPCK